MPAAWEQSLGDSTRLLQFRPPLPLPAATHAALAKANRLKPVTLAALIDQGAERFAWTLHPTPHTPHPAPRGSVRTWICMCMHRFAWINPGESLPGLAEVPEAGAFAYTFKKGTLEVALKDARFDLQPHDSMESIESDLLHPQGRLYVCMSVCMHAYMHVCICIHAYMHACMHTYIHTYTHTHIHTIRSPLQGRRFRRLPGRQTKLRGLLLPRGHLRMIQCERASVFREFDQCIDQTHTPHGACAFLSYCHVSTERVHELEQTLSEGEEAWTKGPAIL